MTFPAVKLRIAFGSTPLASGSWVLGRSELGIDTRLGLWDASAPTVLPDTYPAAVLAQTWSDAYPTVLYTLDISASPPVWAENRDGLPDVYWETAGLRVDPTDIDRAWVLLFDAFGPGLELYRNTALTTGGAWAKVYELDDWLADLGYPGGVVADLLVSFDVSPVDPDLVGILIAANITHGGNTYSVTSWVHSHDGGTTWTRVNYSDDWDAWDVWFRSVAFGRETAERLYIMAGGFKEGEATEYDIWVSDDHGHTITGMIEDGTHDVDGGGQPVPAYGDDDRCYFIEQTDGDVHLTTDGATNIACQSVGTGSFDDEPASSPQDDTDQFYAYLDGDSLQYSLDEGVTILTHADADPDIDIYQVFALLADMVAWAGLNNDTTATVVKMGAETTYADATGNFDTAMADPPIAWCYEIRVNEVAGAVIPGVDAYDDVSSADMSGSIRRGRQNELQRIEAGTLDARLLNLSGDFWPAYAGSIYYPNVLPAKRVQVRVSYGGTDYDVYTGYIERWLPHYLSFGGMGPVTDVQASDFYRFLSAMLLNDPAGYAEELSGTRIDNVLDDLGVPDSQRDLDAGQTMVIATGALANANALEHLRMVQDTEQGIVFQAGGGNVVFQDRHARLTPPLSTVAATFGDRHDFGKALVLDGLDDYILETPDIDLTAINFTWECWFTTAWTPTGDGQERYLKDHGSGNWLLWYDQASGVKRLNLLHFTVDDVGHYSVYPITLVEGQRYHVAAVYDNGGSGMGLYLNGILVASNSSSDNLRVLVRPETVGASQAGTFTWFGTIDEVRLSNICRYTANFAPYPAPFVDDADTLYLWHLDEGTGTVANDDNSVHVTERDGAIQGNPTWVNSVGASKVRDIELEMSDAIVYNDVRVTRSGGTEQVASDGMSQQDYGYRSLEKTGLLMTTDAEALSMAQYVLGQHKDAHLRVLSLTIDPEADPADLWPKVLGFDLGTKIQVTLADAAIDEPYFIEGIEHRFGPMFWETKWWLSRADPFEYWVLGTSKLGTETRLGY